ncbi:MAG: hypothetical protein ABI700_29385 [Chloroflexota bacterium]
MISGAGPTLCAICDNCDVAERVAKAMAAIYDGVRIASQCRCTQVASEGARIV